MKRTIMFLSSAVIMVCSSAAAPVAVRSTGSVIQSQVDCYGTYEEGLAEGRIIRQQLINQYGNGTPAFNDAITAERARASEGFQTASKECRQYWRGLLDGL